MLAARGQSADIVSSRAWTDDGLVSTTDRERANGLWADYGHALDTYRHLADIRFKLLAFVPTLSGAAIALLARAERQGRDVVALASLGLIVTLGIVIYDQRNSQFYNGAISRAQHLEKELRLPKFEGDKNRGLFGSRDDHQRQYFLLLPVWHGLGLALVYGPVLGAWAFAVVLGSGSRSGVALAVGVAVAALSFAQFMWNDGAPNWLRRQWGKRPHPHGRSRSGSGGS